MKFRRLPKHFKLPEYLNKKQQEDIILAIKKGTPIIVSGKQGSTGKTTLVNFLRSYGVKAYEEWETVEIKLDKPLKK